MHLLRDSQQISRRHLTQWHSYWRLEQRSWPVKEYFTGGKTHLAWILKNLTTVTNGQRQEKQANLRKYRQTQVSSGCPVLVMEKTPLVRSKTNTWAFNVRIYENRTRHSALFVSQFSAVLGRKRSIRKQAVNFQSDLDELGAKKVIFLLCGHMEPAGRFLKSISWLP